MASEKPVIIEDEKVVELTPKEETPQEERALQWVRIMPGDTWETFTERYQTTQEKICEDNKITPDLFRFGYWLWV